ncbi:uncharacterized protein LOC129346546 [Eublepharis macularius]|uniref:Uncharacterized protein LOC129346546 n=1 Tax=Eublepharis macularius TaxID=481883 RepID=A0AA97LM49_EUBMA|nr:uncharacterized protein LOC129346546 [Eublepharis macularius]
MALVPYIHVGLPRSLRQGLLQGRPANGQNQEVPKTMHSLRRERPTGGRAEPGSLRGEPGTELPARPPSAPGHCPTLRCPGEGEDRPLRQPRGPESSRPRPAPARPPSAGCSPRSAAAARPAAPLPAQRNPRSRARRRRRPGRPTEPRRAAPGCEAPAAPAGGGPRGLGAAPERGRPSAPLRSARPAPSQHGRLPAAGAGEGGRGSPCGAAAAPQDKVRQPLGALQSPPVGWGGLSLGPRSEVPGCADCGGAMGGAGPHAHDWGSERIEPCGISCSTRQSPQVACKARIPATEAAPAAGVNVVVVVDGNCILQYTHRQSPCSCLSDGEPLLPRHPPPTYGGVPPSPTIPRGPACGQEAGPPPSRRLRGLNVHCCTKACLGDEEDRAERHVHRRATCSRLTPVPLPHSPSGPWFGVGCLSGGRPGARVVKIWDPQRCPLLEEGDIIAKVNGADVRDLRPEEVETVLQEHTRAGGVILLVERKGHPSWRQPHGNCCFRREHLLPDHSHNKEVPRDTPNPWGGSPGDTLAVTSFVGPEPRDVLVCPARCSQRLRRPRPAGGAGEPACGTDGPKEEDGCSTSIVIPTNQGGTGLTATSLLPNQEEGPVHQEDGGLLARLSHGEVGGIFRQAGSRVRMRVRNRKDAGVPSDLNTADIDVGENPRSPSYRLPHPQELKETSQYAVELLRGPKGFGFSLRGGSEYNMDIYVLALMEGGPAQQCGKIQVSDQLVEINGAPTVGMTHAQAVEHIRSGGSRIHLVLKKGNGFVPDYDRGYSKSPTKLQQVPEAEDKARQRRRRSNLPGPPQHQGPNVCDGGSQEASPSNRQQLPKTQQPNRQHRSSTKAEGDEENEEGEGGCRHQEQGKTAGGGGDTCKLLSPRPSRKLRSDLVPGPWLVPSKERLSRALWGVCMGQGEEEEPKGETGRGKGMEVKRRS